jgi:hypothetical protein
MDSDPLLRPSASRLLLVSKEMSGHFTYDCFDNQADGLAAAAQQWRSHVLYEVFDKGTLPRELLAGGVGVAHGSIRRYTHLNLLVVPPAAVHHALLYIKRGMTGVVVEESHADEQAARTSAALARGKWSTWVLYLVGANGMRLEIDYGGLGLGHETLRRRATAATAAGDTCRHDAVQRSGSGSSGGGSG